MPEPTVAQRIVRAKRTLTEKQVPFEVPRGAELAARLASVLEVIYLIFNEVARPRPATTGCVPRSARTHSASAGSSPSSPPRTRSPRPRRPDGDPGLAIEGACGRVRFPHSPPRSRIEHSGIICSSVEDSPHSNAGEARWRSRPLRAPGRHRRLPRPSPRPRPKPTGSESPPSTKRSPNSRNHRSSS